MLAALSIATLLVSSSPPPTEEICELRNILPGRASSTYCMGCHDGTVAPVAAVTFPNTLEGFPNSPDGHDSHPVEMSYDEAALRRPGSLTPMALLPPELILPEGKVTCATCHHPDSSQPLRVSLSMDGSAMCRACHLY